jgi:hypothetical protein
VEHFRHLLTARYQLLNTEFGNAEFENTEFENTEFENTDASICVLITFDHDWEQPLLVQQCDRTTPTSERLCMFALWHITSDKPPVMVHQYPHARPTDIPYLSAAAIAGAGDATAITAPPQNTPHPPRNQRAPGPAHGRSTNRQPRRPLPSGARQRGSAAIAAIWPVDKSSWPTMSFTASTAAALSRYSACLCLAGSTMHDTRITYRSRC